MQSHDAMKSNMLSLCLSTSPQSLCTKSSKMAPCTMVNDSIRDNKMDIHTDTKVHHNELAQMITEADSPKI